MQASSSTSIDGTSTTSLKKRVTRKRKDVMENEENTTTASKRARKDMEDDNEVDWNQSTANKTKKRKRKREI